MVGDTPATSRAPVGQATGRAAEGSATSSQTPINDSHALSLGTSRSSVKEIALLTAGIFVGVAVTIIGVCIAIYIIWRRRLNRAVPPSTGAGDQASVPGSQGPKQTASPPKKAEGQKKTGEGKVDSKAGEGNVDGKEGEGKVDSKAGEKKADSKAGEGNVDGKEGEGKVDSKTGGENANWPSYQDALDTATVIRIYPYQSSEATTVSPQTTQSISQLLPDDTAAAPPRPEAESEAESEVDNCEGQLQSSSSPEPTNPVEAVQEDASWKPQAETQDKENGIDKSSEAARSKQQHPGDETQNEEVEGDMSVSMTMSTVYGEQSNSDDGSAEAVPIIT